MNIHALLKELDELKISIALVGGKIRVNAPKGAMTKDLLAQVAAAKPQLIAHFQLLSEPVIPQSFGQSQLWFLEQLAPGNPIYNNPLAMRITGGLDVPRMQAAINDVAQRHDILRTHYFNDNGTPSQRIGSVGLVPFREVDLTGPDGAMWVQQEMEAEARRGFDLRAEWPIRSVVLTQGAQTHFLLLTVHHIAADGWSIGLLLGEIAAHYNARSGGGPPQVPMLEWQYVDYALQQQAFKESASYRQQKKYWQQRLADCPVLLDLPTDRPRPVIQSFRGAHHSIDIGPAVGAQLTAYCKARAITPFAAIMALHFLVMAKNSGQDDIAVGTPQAGRDQQQLEPLIGHFINSLVLLGHIDWNTCFDDLVTQVNHDLLTALSNGEIPFEAVVEMVNPPRSQGHSPLFQNMLIYQNTPQGRLEFDGLQVESLHTDSGTAKYDLTVEVFMSDDGLRFGFEYNSDLFDSVRVASWGDQYSALLSWLMENPENPLTQAEFMGADEKRRVLVDYAHGKTVPLRHATAHAAFEARVDQMPNARALVFKGRSVSFVKLERAANRLANTLISKGIGSDARVGICIKRSPAFVIGMLAVLKTGALYVPMDPSYPQARLKLMLDDCAPEAMLADVAGQPALLNGFDVFSPELDGTGDSTRPNIAVQAQDAAYILYTSGSTGKPKGVQIPHRALVNLCQWMEDDYPVAKDPGAVLQKTSQGFDASIWEFWWALTSGREMVIASTEQANDPCDVASLIQSHDVVAAQFVPVTLGLFVDALGADACRSLRHIFCGGGALTTTLTRAVCDKLPNVTLWNVYGPTEACVDNTIARIVPKDCDGVVPIGRPVPNTCVYVLDKQMYPVPPGIRGEVYIGGSGVALGYLNQPGWTANSFVASPFVAEGRFYRTGDLASWSMEGQLIFHGRRDFQIKHNGCRIEPGDIEIALQNRGAGGALVLARDDRLVGYTTGLEAAQAGQLRDDISSELPDYMIPDVIMPLDQFPLLPNGKIDRRALPLPDTAVAMHAVNQSTPRDGTEMAILRVWQRVLTHDRIGIRDNFFDLGGSSIAAIKVVHEIRQDLGIHLPLRQVIAHPTIEKLAAFIRDFDTTAPAQDDRVIRFSEGVGRGTLICIHPAGGTGFCYLPLAQVLPESLKVLAVQSSGLSAGEQILTDVSSMANSYLKQLGTDCDGPVVLTGLSFGGLVAHEMGRILAENGRRDVSVVLLDTQGMEDAEERRKIDAVDLGEFREKLVRFNGTYPGIEDAQIMRYFRVYNKNRLAVRTYEVPPTCARTVFIQAHDSLPRSYLHSARRFWKRHAKCGFAVHLVRGGHWDMLESSELKLVHKVILQEFDDLREMET